MDNIYGQTDIERYSAVTLPEGFAKECGTILYSWLGSLWHGLNKGDGMVRGMQEARGLRLAQMYIDAIETLRLNGRDGAPVFHRELWHPIAIRLSMRNKSQENLLKMGEGCYIGPQPEGSLYGEGTVLKMGKMGDYENYVTYPVDADIVGGAAMIVDNPINPTVILERGADGGFEMRNQSVIFPKDMDPLGDGSAFERHDIPGFDPDDPERSDMEAVLWASDVLIDRDYVSNHLSYALGADAPSSDVVKRIVNAAWSSVASGLTPELVNTLIAAMLNVPVIQNGSETVTDIYSEEDGTKVVATDKGAYRVSGKAKLRECVVPGATLARGSLLDESVRIYPFLNSVPGVSGSGAVAPDVGFSVPLEQDIPSVVLRPEMLRARTEFGIYAMWGNAKVKRSVRSPGSDSRPHLYFDIGGSGSDVAAFWDDVWAKADSSGVNMESILGRAGDVISPAGFMLKQLVGANTLFVVVDRSQIDDVSMMRNPMFFDMLSSVVPSAIRLFLVEHRSVGEEDEMDLGEAKEGEDVYAALPRVVDSFSESGPPWSRRGGATFGERVSARFVRLPPAKTRGTKEEN